MFAGIKKLARLLDWLFFLFNHIWAFSVYLLGYAIKRVFGLFAAQLFTKLLNLVIAVVLSLLSYIVALKGVTFIAIQATQLMIPPVATFFVLLTTTIVLPGLCTDIIFKLCYTNNAVIDELLQEERFNIRAYMVAMNSMPGIVSGDYNIGAGLSGGSSAPTPQPADALFPHFDATANTAQRLALLEFNEAQRDDPFTKFNQCIHNALQKNDLGLIWDFLPKNMQQSKAITAHNWLKNCLGRQDRNPLNPNTFWSKLAPEQLIELSNKNPNLCSVISQTLMSIPVYIQKLGGKRTYIDLFEALQLFQNNPIASSEQDLSLQARNPETMAVFTYDDLCFDPVLYSVLQTLKQALDTAETNSRHAVLKGNIVTPQTYAFAAAKHRFAQQSRNEVPMGGGIRMDGP